MLGRVRVRIDKWEKLFYLLTQFSSWLCIHLGCYNMLTDFWSSHKDNWALRVWLISDSMGEQGPGTSYFTMMSPIFVYII